MAALTYINVFTATQNVTNASEKADNPNSIWVFLLHSIGYLYEGGNFNFGNAAVTFDTAHLQSSYFHRPSMYYPKLCRTRSQR